jgi:CRISPR-associated protein Cmr3
MRRAHIALLPRDGFFCKDGRGWFTSASGRGHGLEWPWPSTILGALRTAWGRAEEDRSKACFGPGDWLARTKPIQLGRVLALRRPRGAQWAAEHIAWPAPFDAVWFEDEANIQRLDPRPPNPPGPLTLGRDDDAAREALWRPSPARTDKPGKLPPWWRHAELVAWLAGQTVRAQRKNGLELTRRLQAHVGIRGEELTADEGVLFSHDVVETLEPQAEWAIGVEVSLPDNDLLAAVCAWLRCASDSDRAVIERCVRSAGAVAGCFSAGNRWAAHRRSDAGLLRKRMVARWPDPAEQ